LFKDGEEVRGRGRVGLKGCFVVTVAFRKNSVFWDDCINMNIVSQLLCGLKTVFMNFLY